ncbi:MAG: NTP transferase domain-containing protein [Ruminococcus sp.]|nr:NTP transferase domain-containing protein [Ruminococcus sp.]
MNNNVIILAGGQGKRMKSDGPKVLCQVQGRAMLDWVITACENAGIGDICVVKGHKAEMIDDFLAGRDSRADIKTVLQSERLGTGHAVQMAKDFLEAHRGGNTLILCGDAPFIDPPTIEGALKLHTSEGNSVTVVTSEKEDPTGYGRIIRTENGISGIVEQKDCTPEQAQIKEINSGCYWFDTSDLLDVLFELTPNNAQGEYYLTDCLGLLIGKGKRADAYISENPNVSLGANDPAGLAYLNELAEQMG